MRIDRILHPARFLSRPNRFGVWVEIEGRSEYVHLPDPGRLRELLIPGTPVWLAPGAGAARKTRYDLVLVRQNGHLVSIDTGLPTRTVREALRGGTIPEFQGYQAVRPEVRFGGSRLDFLLTGDSGACLVEVKSVTLVQDGRGLFPDAVTERGTRHLQELRRAVQEGYRACVFFVVQREDANSCAPNEGTDPGFAQALRLAVASGVEALAYTCQVSLHDISLLRRIPVVI